MKSFSFFDKEENSGLKSAIKNYLKCLSHFSPEKIMICLPVKNDFGDMTKEDFEEWKTKRETINITEQRKFVLQTADKMGRNKELSKQLLKNKKIILDLIDE